MNNLIWFNQITWDFDAVDNDRVIQQIQVVLQPLVNEIDKINNSLKNLNSDINFIKTELSNLKNKISKIEDSIPLKIKELENLIIERINNWDDNLNKKIISLDERIKALETQP